MFKKFKFCYKTNSENMHIILNKYIKTYKKRSMKPQQWMLFVKFNNSFTLIKKSLDISATIWPSSVKSQISVKRRIYIYVLIYLFNSKHK